MTPAENARQVSAPSTWEFVIEGFNPLTERVVESLLAVSNGQVGSQSSLPEGSSVSNPATFVAGVFESDGLADAMPALAVAPDWLTARVYVEGHRLDMEHGRWLSHRRRLDFRAGAVLREWRHRDRSGRVTRMTFRHAASLADRHVLLQDISVQPENYSGQLAFELLISGRQLPGLLAGSPGLDLQVSDDRKALIARARRSGLHLAFVMDCGADFDEAEVSAIESSAEIGRRWRWDAYLGRVYGFTKTITVGPAGPELDHANLPDDYAALRQRHEDAWAERWRKADIGIAGNDAHQRATRFAIYHLIGAANPNDERVSIGARGLTGESYKGHVFWDTDIFLTPFYVATQPSAARSLLMYRYHSLPAARAKAQRLGYEGALYAWESADTGEEVTPERARGLSGEVIQIWTGLRAHHISADVAYAVWQYWQATRDVDFLLQGGAEIILETARFWASRAMLEGDGRCHIRGVIGPDEYHECVDDNAYTNGLARWNLVTAAQLVAMLSKTWPDHWARLRDRLRLDPWVVDQWRVTADRLVDGLDQTTGLIEQFNGYHNLQEVDLTAFEPRDAPMDVLLGREGVEQSKVVKQADVLMLLFLLRDAYPRSVIEANYRYYEPRTGHGSSLSPGIHATLAARLGDGQLVERYLEQTMAIDLDDQMGNAAGGIHMAAQGSLWQAAVFGCAGVEWRDDSMVVAPWLPPSWRGMNACLQWRGRSLQLSVDAETETTEIKLLDGRRLVTSTPATGQRSIEAGQSQREPTSSSWEISEEAK